MAVVVLPGLLARECGGQARFEVEAGTVRDALRALPVASLVLASDGALRPLVNVYVDREPTRDLAAPVGPASEVLLVAAIAGG